MNSERSEEIYDVEEKIQRVKKMLILMDCKTAHNKLTGEGVSHEMATYIVTAAKILVDDENPEVEETKPHHRIRKPRSIYSEHRERSGVYDGGRVIIEEDFE